MEQKTNQELEEKEQFKTKSQLIFIKLCFEQFIGRQKKESKKVSQFLSKYLWGLFVNCVTKRFVLARFRAK